MRSPRALVILISLLMACMPVLAEESSAGSFSEGIKQTTQPLLKALSMIGTPYKFGGAKPEKGMDCSGFVRHVYKESNELTLPRTA